MPKICVDCGKDCNGEYCSFSYNIDEKTNEAINVKVLCYLCNKKKYTGEYQTSKRLSNKITMDAAMHEVYNEHNSLNDEDKLYAKLYDEVNDSMIRIKRKYKEFESKIWFNGLQNTVLNSNKRGFSGKISNGNKMLAWSCAARTLITLDNETTSVTLITADDSTKSVMGCQGIDGLESDVISLIDSFLNTWPICMNSDDQVTMAGL